MSPLPQTSQSEIYRKIGATGQDSRVSSDADGIAGVLTGRYAFIKVSSETRWSGLWRSHVCTGLAQEQCHL